jgi:hypothetical protein
MIFGVQAQYKVKVHIWLSRYAVFAKRVNNILDISKAKIIS